MKLVLCYTAGDDCAWYADVVLPIEYSSEEALICDFDEILTKANNEGKCYFLFGKEEFKVEYFYYGKPFLKECWVYNNDDKNLPSIYTLENWFIRNNINP